MNRATRAPARTDEPGSLDVISASRVSETTNAVSDRPEVYGSSTVEKALDVLTVVAEADHGLSNLDVSRILGLDKSTSHRLLMTLERKGYVRKSAESRRYTLGPHMSYLAAHAYARWKTLVPPALQNLVTLTNESANFSLRHGSQFLCLDSLPSPEELRYCPKIGGRYPLNAGASGKAILAFIALREKSILDELSLHAFTDRTITKQSELMHEIGRIQSQGYATSAGERIVGGCAIAAPVFDAAGDIIGALSISAVEARCPLPRLLEFRVDLLREAERLSDGAFSRTRDLMGKAE